MGIEYASVVDHPIEEVFAWHTRPGAMRRLVPPWQPMRVVAETTSLADGTAILGLPAGIIAALRPNSFWDYGVMFFSNVGFAIPSFLVATLLIYYVSLKAGLLPTNGWEGWKYKILPSFALGLLPMAYFARLVRGSMLETLQQDYVRTAKAKGLRRRRIVMVHVLRNSLIPAVTAMAPLLGFILTGTFVIEIIFSIPGIGRYFVSAVTSRDYSVVMGITVLTSVVIVKPGGTGRPRFAISASPAPLPPSRLRIEALPSARPSPKL